MKGIHPNKYAKKRFSRYARERRIVARLVKGSHTRWIREAREALYGRATLPPVLYRCEMPSWV